MTVLLSDDEIATIVERVVWVARPERVLMFGSYAKGRAHARSDLDLLVVMPTGTPDPPRPSDFTPYLGGGAVRVDVHVVTEEELREYGRQEHHFLHSVLRTCRTLYPATAAAGCR